jgi:Zn-dependent M28 family amino/carboxypeptidase
MRSEQVSRRWAIAAVVAVMAVCRAAADAPTVLDVVNQVAQSSYTSYLNNSLYTHTGDDRGYGTQHDLARTSIYNSFVSLGLETSLSPFTYSSSTYYNVAGILRGTTLPNEYIIVGAHYDSVGSPGADDNASGCAGVLEAARAMSQYTFQRSIVFMGFDREEQGLIGSSAWASAHAGWDIKGMVSLDMIAYNPAGPTHDTALMYGRTAAIQNALAAALRDYSGITAAGAGPYDASDHAPFEWNGKPATLLIEGAVWSNPYYHQPSDSVDTLGYIEYDYATRMTRGTVAYLAAEAYYSPEPSTLVLLILAGALRLRRRR